MEVGRTVIGLNPLQEKHINTINCNHPENPERIARTRQILGETGLLSKCTVIEEFPSIDVGDLKETHDGKYIAAVRGASDMPQSQLNVFSSNYDSVFMSPGTVEAALQGVACCRHLSESIVEGKFDNGFAIVRPPGHHADQTEASGFCLLNNAAQAAEAAFNFGADKILIVDLDVHHGHGTQRVFYNDKRVLYFSVHRYEKGSFWPHLRESNYDYIGEGPGTGYNVNVPLNETGCEDGDYLSIFWHVLWPLAVEFNPQFIIVSAGFDSCSGDPLGEMKLSVDCYAHFIYHLKALAKGKLLAILEGGYNHDVVAWGVQRCVRVLCGLHPMPLVDVKEPRQSTAQSCLNVISALKAHWKCFEFYSLSVGSHDLPLTVESETEFVPGDESLRTNTADILQESLPRYEYTSAHGNDGIEISLAIAYEDSAETHYNKHDSKHPECPNRVIKICQLGLEKDCQVLETTDLISLEQLEDTHERPFIQLLARTKEMDDEKLKRTADDMSSIFLLQTSFDAARKAATAVVQCVDRVLSSPGASKAFAAIRPPGHHSGISSANGFCLLNNVAIAANHARKTYGLRRVLILDWDIHHGNGTQEIFEEDPEVLFISIHRHDEGLFYPMGEPKDYMDVGSGPGKGFTVNIPWSYGYMGDAEYVCAFYKVIMPIVYQFNPEIVFISAGFDAAAGDPLGEFKVSPAVFSLMTYQLASFANGKIVALLEGGYNLDAVANSAAAVVQTLRCGSPSDKLELSNLSSLSENALIALRRVVGVQSQHWETLRHFQVMGEHVYEYGCYSSSSSDESADESEEKEHVIEDNGSRIDTK